MYPSIRSTLSRARSVILAAGLAAAFASPAIGQTEFTYQGVLSNAGSPVTGLESIRFRLFNAPTGGTLFGETTQNVDVTDGVFTAPLNLGPLNTIDPASAWLEIAVDTGGGTFDVLGRQKITAAPFSMNTRGLNVGPSGDAAVGGRFTVGGRELFFPDFWDMGAEGNDHFSINETNVAPRLTVALGGNVGVGTTDPLATLHIKPATAPLGDPDPADLNFGTDILAVSEDANLDLVSADRGQAASRISLTKLDFNDSTFVDRWELVHGSTSGGDALRFLHAFTPGGGAPLMTLLPDGKVGIGTDTPTQRLDVDGGAAVGGSLFVSGGLFMDNPNAVADIAGRLRLDDNTHRIGPTSFSNVALTIDTALAFGLVLTQGDAGKPGGGSWANTSDRRLKKNIESIDNALETVLALKGVTYEYKDAEAVNELPGERIGFIAQDVEAVIPDWISEHEDGYKRMTIRGFEALAVEAIREQQAQIEALEATVESLKAERSMFTSSLAWPMVGLLGIGGVAVARRRATKV